MRKQAYPIVSVTGGLALSVDPAKIENSQFCHLRNFDFYKGSLRRCVPWQEALGSAVSEVPMIIDTLYLSSGSSYLVMVTVDKAYYYNTTTGAWTFITDSDIFTGSVDNNFTSCITVDSGAADIIIFVNGIDKPQKWEGPAGDWDDLGGVGDVSLTSAKACVVFYNHLLLGGTVEGGVSCPFRIRWTDTADPEEFVDGTAGFIDLLDTVDWVVAIVLFKDQCFIFKERSIWEITHVGGDSVFGFELVVDGVGTYSPASITAVGESLYFYGSDNIYSFDGRYLKSIGDELVPLLYDTETSIVRRAEVHKAQAIYVEETAQYLLAIPTENTYPDEVFIYDTVEEAWSRRQLEVQCFGYWQAETPTTWVAAKATGDSWEDVSGMWRSRKLSEDAPTTLRADYTNKTVYEDRRNPASGTTLRRAEATTKIFTLGLQSRVMCVEFMCKGNDFEYAYSVDEGAIWSDWITVSPTNVDTFYGVKKFLNLSCDRIQLKFHSENRYCEIKWYIIWYMPRVRNQIGEE